MTSVTGAGDHADRTALRRYWTAFVVGAIALAAAGLVVTIAGGRNPLSGESGQELRFMALACVLCAFPAGAAAADVVTLSAAPRARALALIPVSGVLVGLLSLALSSVAAPSLVRPVSTDRTIAAPSAAPRSIPSALTLAALRNEDARISRADLRSADAIRYANEVRWEYHHRLALAVLAPILACFGTLARLWLRWPRRAEARALLLWGAGLATLIVVYGSLEQSFDAAVASTVLLPHPAWREILGPPLAVTVALAWAAIATWRTRGSGDAI